MHVCKFLLVTIGPDPVPSAQRITSSQWIRVRRKIWRGEENRGRKGKE